MGSPAADLAAGLNTSVTATLAARLAAFLPEGLARALAVWAAGLAAGLAAGPSLVASNVVRGASGVKKNFLLAKTFAKPQTPHALSPIQSHDLVP